MRKTMDSIGCKIPVCQGIPLAFLAVTLSPALNAQGADSLYNPFFVTSSSSNAGNIYETGKGLLTLPQITVLPEPNGTVTSLFNARLQHKGDYLFELMAVEELQPQQECTRAEVLDAIPKLTLDLDIASVEQLIGCDARISAVSTDLEKGRLVNAIWQGADGVSNTGSSTGGGSTWIPRSAVFVSYSPFSAVRFPSITLSLREGVFESISYMPEATQSLCLNADLLPGFEQIGASDTIQQINEKLGCSANLDQVVMGHDLEQRNYSWQSQTQQTVFFNPALPSPETMRQSITLSVVNGAVHNPLISINADYNTETPCSAEEIVAAAATVQQGQAAGNLAELLNCGPRSASYFKDDLTERTTYRWQSLEPGGTLFETKNRLLHVTVLDGVVSSVSLSRM